LFGEDFQYLTPELFPPTLKLKKVQSEKKRPKRPTKQGSTVLGPRPTSKGHHWGGRREAKIDVLGPTKNDKPRKGERTILCNAMKKKYISRIFFDQLKTCCLILSPAKCPAKSLAKTKENPLT
jgi:hypothetical protein